MADKKISELTALTGANVATDDQLVIVDTSAALTKSITIDEFKNALDTATGFVRITGDTMTGDLSMSGANITLGDSSGVSDDRIVLGDDSDLLIYHNNPNSFIRDQGNGNFFITTDGNYIFLAKDDLTNMATFQVDGPVDLYHAGSAKLATTSTGVDITGTLTSDGLTVGSTSYSSISTSEAPTLSTDAHGGEALWLRSGGTSGLGNVQAVLGFGKADGASARTGAAIASIQTDADADRVGLAFYRSGSSASVQTMAKSVEFSHNGNISFFEDTGTTAKFFWSAADESLGIGTSSPSDKLHVQSSGDTKLKVETTGTTAASGHSGLALNTGNGGYLLQNLTTADSTHGVLRIYDTANSAERMRIDSSGNVGIGTQVPGAKLHISNTGGNADIALQGSASGESIINFGDTDDLDVGQILYNHTSNYMRFLTNTSEAMHIDSSGNLLVGKTSLDGGATTGVEFKSTGETTIARSSGSNGPLYINRISNDGNIVTFAKDGSTVGSIYNGGGNLGINSSGGLLLVDDIITPTSANDATYDIGRSSARYKDLYLSGGVVETTTTVSYASSIALTYNNGSIQTVTLTGNVTFTDSLADGESIVLMLNAGASYTVTWPTLTWVTSGGNVAPTLTANDTLVFWKIGSTLYGAYAGSYT